VKKLLLVGLFILLAPIAVYAWDDCPYGLVDDPFPGQCPRYVDSNQDGVCDLSQSPPDGVVNTSTNTENLTGGGRKGTNQENISSVEINEPEGVPGANFYLIPLLILTSISYLVTYFLYLNHQLKRRSHYRIWNYVLTGSFLVSGVSGLVLIILINLGIHTPWNVSIDFWHAEFSIIMAVTSIFHVHLYWKQFKAIFRV
jgi:hypothetical protein